MAKSVLSAPRFHNEAIAFEYVEKPACQTGRCARIAKQQERRSDDSRQARADGPAQVLRLPETFTVRIGTIFEDSHLPLHLWLQIIHLLCARKKGHRPAKFNGCSTAA